MEKILNEVKAELKEIKEIYENKFTKEDAKKIWHQMKLEQYGKYNFEEFYMGLNVELEHGTSSSLWNITNNDPIMTAKIALAHMDERSDYYKRLMKYVEEDNEI